MGGLGRPRGQAKGVRRRRAGSGGGGGQRRSCSSDGLAVREGGLASQAHGEANQRAGVAGVGLQRRIDDDGGSLEKMEEGRWCSSELKSGWALYRQGSGR